MNKTDIMLSIVFRTYKYNLRLLSQHRYENKQILISVKMYLIDKNCFEATYFPISKGNKFWNANFVLPNLT